MKPFVFSEKIPAFTNQLQHGGAFLNSGTAEQPNTMTIGWGSIGIYWGKPTVVVLVRYSRHSFEAIEKMKEFTVSIPQHDMKKALAYCGTKSGRDGNKFEACGMTAVPGQTVSVPIIGECELHYECKVVAKQTLEPTLLDPKIRIHQYPDGDFHTLFYGEITACYEK